MKTCPACGTKTESKFCPECGTDLSLVQDVKVCPKCGTESTTKFCPECGTDLSNNTSDFEPVKITQNTEESLSEQFTEEPVVTPEVIQPDEVQVNETNRGIPVGAVASQMIKTKKSKKKLFIIIGAVVLLLLIIGIGMGGEDEETASTTDDTEAYTEAEEETTEATTEATTEPTTTAPVAQFTKEEDYESISYDNLARNPDDYTGKMVKGSGNVLQVMDGENEVDLRIGTSSDGYDDVVLAYYDPNIVDSRILEDDQVTYYGQSLGLYTYESTMGGDITVPLIEIHKITRD